MPIDVAILAATVVTSFLLPFVKMGAEKIGEKVTEKVSQVSGEHVAGLAKKAWGLVTKTFSSKEEKGTLTQFEKRPDAAKALVEAILKEKLEKDSKLARELDGLVNAESPDGKGTGAQIMDAAIAGIVDMRGAHISGLSHEISGVSIKHPSTPPWHPQRDNRTE